MITAVRLLLLPFISMKQIQRLFSGNSFELNALIKQPIPAEITSLIRRVQQRELENKIRLIQLQR